MDFSKDRKKTIITRLKRAGVWMLNAASTLILCCAGAWLLWELLLVTTFASFTIPTKSMYPAIVPGDRIYVNKWAMGGRVFDIFEAAAGNETPIHRLPGFSPLQRNDVIAFHFPYKGAWDSISMNIGLYYMKRCVAVPGDVFEIRDGVFHVSRPKRCGCPGRRDTVGYTKVQHEMRREFHRLDRDTSYRGLISTVVMQAWPNTPEVPWTVRDFGPLYIPRKGGGVKLDREKFHIYRAAIEWETQKKLTATDDGRFLLGDSAITRYVFTKDYCFVCGDNAWNSRDSRYWGLLPLDYVVGKAFVIYDSRDRATGRRRWNRVLTRLAGT